MATAHATTSSATVHTGAAPDPQRLRDLKTQPDQAINANDMNRVMAARNSLDGILADAGIDAPKTDVDKGIYQNTSVEILRIAKPGDSGFKAGAGTQLVIRLKDGNEKTVPMAEVTADIGNPAPKATPADDDDAKTSAKKY